MVERIAVTPEIFQVSHPRILVLEDEKNVGSTLVERLRLEGFDVTWVTEVEAARRAIRSSSELHSEKNFDLAILDIGLPDGSGFDVASQLRESYPGTAVIFLTARGNPEDRIRGLELGAEDYVVKPFHLKELILRIRNGLKRARYLAGNEGGLAPTVTIGKARIHFERFEAEIAEGTGGKRKLQRLTHKEASLLKLMVERRGCVVSRDEILNHAWSEDEFPTPRTVDNFIMRLRRLVETNPEEPQVIKSVRGIGYQMV